VTVENLYLTDTHCHLNFASFHQDRDLVIERAREAGLERILNPGIDLETSRIALQLADDYPEVYGAIGVHPNSALTWGQETYRELEKLASNPKVVAIGEIGLDYYRLGAPIEVQQSVFRAQLELAGNIGYPVIIHCREAFTDLREILVDWIGAISRCGSGLSDRPGVLHSYTGDRATAEWAVENKFFIGINGPVTYRNANRVHLVAANAPLENILLETDAPFLPPHPHRGERNEPAHVALIAGKIAALRIIEKSQVTQSTAINANRLFCWREIH
jgi:TatD DNase family protein